MPHRHLPSNADMKSSTKLLIPLAIALALLVAACGDDDASGSEATGTDAPATTTTAVPLSEFTTTMATEAPQFGPVDYEGFRAQPTACGAKAPDPIELMTFDEPEDMSLDPTTAITVTISTSCGDIVAELDPSVAPETVNSFVFLAEQGYFDGGASHRIAPGFVMQAGDPTATGRGGPGYAIADELPPDDFLYTRGTLAMANAGPGTGGSQFFIMLDDAGLPPAYSVFGQVVEGLEVLDLIASVPLGFSPSGEPSSPLESVYLVAVTVDLPS
jgi:cyclophilin family peptidyl-prolyl cis-trans isomerase